MARTTSVLITGLAAACHESIGLNRLGSKVFLRLSYPKTIKVILQGTSRFLDIDTEANQAT
jgi:hypothetical protein